jgi:hypothetical protein
MLKEKEVKVLREKVGVVKEVKDVRHIVSGPNALVEQLPTFIGSTPKDKTLVMIVTDDDYVEKIKSIDISDDLIGLAYAEIQAGLDYDNQVIFCLYISEPDKYRVFADDLMNDYGPDVVVRDILYITDTHWGSYLCIDNEHCCPVGGHER